MKFVLIALFSTMLTFFGIWVVDVWSDQTHSLRVKEETVAYLDWTCGLDCQAQEQEAFALSAGSVYDVRRIRYGKDFMAVKIVHNQNDAWVIYSPAVALITES